MFYAFSSFFKNYLSGILSNFLMQWSSSPKIQFRIPDHLETNKKKEFKQKN